MQGRDREHEPNAASGPAGRSPAGLSEDQAAPDGPAAESGTLPLDETGADQAVTDGTTGPATPRSGGLRQGRRLALGIGAAATAALVAFAAFAAAGGLSGPPDASSVIPSPPRENKVFVEDDDGTGADSQANILSSAAPGLVHILAPATSAGLGVVLTPSGLVLTSAQGLQGARRLTVRVVLSGRSYPARLVGTDRSYGLSLLQIAGGPAFRPVAIGNSRYLSRGATVTAVGSAGLTRTFTLDIGNLTSGTGVLAAGGQRLTGLLVSTAQVVAGEETGGPLVNLSGQAIGINVAGTGSGLRHTGFAVPIDTALAVAKRIQATHSR
ncbi:MAG TPA: trypsin-like peptidase domain-containing protein [Streptosporangiaceae bacterium]|jgi:S1-C subfamily serine protease|nr:trypsin-like peptidase domain-containing protein [Streptosporangiaceae bacterium]